MLAWSDPMKVIGLTDKLRSEADRQCGAGFRAWIAETKEGTWGNWEELKKHYPGVCRMSNDEAHFPLTTDGTGVRAMVFFQPGFLMLRGIAPAPLPSRISSNLQISQPPKNRHTATPTKKP